TLIGFAVADSATLLVRASARKMRSPPSASTPRTAPPMTIGMGLRARGAGGAATGGAGSSSDSGVGGGTGSLTGDLSLSRGGVRAADRARERGPGPRDLEDAERFLDLGVGADRLGVGELDAAREAGLEARLDLRVVRLRRLARADQRRQRVLRDLGRGE